LIDNQVSGHSINGRIHEVIDRIAAAAIKSGRCGEDITLVAVSKTIDIDPIREALLTGHRHFGENRVQEAKNKWPELKVAFPDTKLHLIGPLQTNKVRDAVGLFDVIETVDRIRLIEKLGSECASQNRYPLLLIEVNTGGEIQKTGIIPQELGEFLEKIKQTCPNLNVGGLMCIPPINEEPALHFALLTKLARDSGLTTISMGMSQDYETAIRLGANQVRVGTAIFGARQT